MPKTTSVESSPLQQHDETPQVSVVIYHREGPKIVVNDAVGDGGVETLLSRLTAARAADLDELAVGTSAKMAWYMKHMFIALVNKLIVNETTGNSEQFDDSDVSIGTIAAAFDSDGTDTTRKRMVQ